MVVRATRMWLAATMGAVAVGCASPPKPLPPPPVQRICGQAVSFEVAIMETDLFRVPVAEVYAGSPFLLRFSPTCHGVRVSPDPSVVLTPRTPPSPLVGQVRDASGLIAGIYESTPTTTTFSIYLPAGVHRVTVTVAP
jgi:hypothetical protein